MIAKLNERIRETAPIVVGLDPKLDYIPDRIKKPVLAEYGKTAEAVGEIFWLYNREIVDHVMDLIPAVKPQIAMYEQFGLEGLRAYKRTVDYCRSHGLIVISDVKRGDIGSTSASYAEAHLGKTAVGDGSAHVTGFETDFVTVNPYLGTDGVQPFVDVCAREDKGIFVLVKTSNPSSGEFQDRLVVDETSGRNRPLYELVGEMVEHWGASSMDGDYSNVGAVVGATYPEQGRILRELMPHACILVPGYGAQGGKGSDLVHFFRPDGLGAIVNSSRGIIAAWQKDERFRDSGNVGQAARAAVVDMREDIAQALEGR
ncbi:MAG: orotidine-5'-phosphate decarboxylase [Butyrivibrio sp.]|nr:orotidine-5'-phosphate decarboxylase [Butyrivibrio sp.]